jgi:hypothetical protein
VKLERWLTSLAVRLTLGVGLLGVLSAGVVGVAVVRRSQATLHDSLARQGLATADLAAASAADFVSNSHEDARELAAVTRSQASRAQLSGLSPELARWRADHAWAQAALIVDLSGRILAGSSSVPEPDGENDALLARVPFRNARHAPEPGLRTCTSMTYSCGGTSKAH